MELSIELLLKLVVLIVSILSAYFLLKNSINIISERQQTDHKTITDTTTCLDRYRERFTDTEAKLAVQQVTINNIEDDIEKICHRIDCHIDKQ